MHCRLQLSARAQGPELRRSVEKSEKSETHDGKPIGSEPLRTSRAAVTNGKWQSADLFSVFRPGQPESNPQVPEVGWGGGHRTFIIKFKKY